MRDKDRIDIFCKELAEVWKTQAPDWRFGQIICNLQFFAGNDLFYYEEDQFLELLKMFLKSEC